jgi:hypothetical protein
MEEAPLQKESGPERWVNLKAASSPHIRNMASEIFVMDSATLF